MALWRAERDCANRINSISGADPIGPMTDASGGKGYGMDEIPDNAETPWGATDAREETCGDRIVKGVVVDGGGAMLSGIGHLFGISHDSNGWDFFSGKVAGEAWKGTGMFVVGALA